MNTEIITLSIEAKGEIISSNFPIFAEMVRARLSEINRDLQTDEDFAQADADAKAIASAESALKDAKEKALHDAEQLHELFSQIDGLTGDLAKARLDLSKQVTKRKEEVKTELVETYLAMFDIDASLARKQFLAGLQATIKGRKNIDAMRGALADFFTANQAQIDQCRKLLDSFEKAHGTEMTMDRRQLEIETTHGLEAELRRRFEAKKAADEKKRLEAEAAAARAAAFKAQAEADAKVKAAEAKAKAEIEAAKKPAPEPLPTPPKIDSIPTGSKAAAPGESNVVPLPDADNSAEEWEAFKTAVFTSFGPLKSARESLKNTVNIARAKIFADGINTAWTAANAKEAEQ